MGSTDAINALRSDAVAKTTLMNVVSDQIGTVNSDSQKISGMFSAAKQSISTLYVSQLSKIDSTRGKLRSSVGSIYKTTNDMIAKYIKAAQAKGLPPGMDEYIPFIIDLRVMGVDINDRNLIWDTVAKAGGYLSLYSPESRGVIAR